MSESSQNDNLQPELDTSLADELVQVMQAAESHCFAASTREHEMMEIVKSRIRLTPKMRSLILLALCLSLAVMGLVSRVCFDDLIAPVRGFDFFYGLVYLILATIALFGMWLITSEESLKGKGVILSCAITAVLSLLTILLAGFSYGDAGISLPNIYIPSEILAYSVLVSLLLIIDRMQDRGTFIYIIAFLFTAAYSMIIVQMKVVFGLEYLIVAMLSLGTAFFRDIYSSDKRSTFVIAALSVVVIAIVIIIFKVNAETVSALASDGQSSPLFEGFMMAELDLSRYQAQLIGPPLQEDSYQFLYLNSFFSEFALVNTSVVFGRLAASAIVIACVSLIVLLFRAVGASHKAFLQPVPVALAGLLCMNLVYSLLVNIGFLVPAGRSIPFLGSTGFLLIAHCAMAGMLISYVWKPSLQIKIGKESDNA